MPILSEKMNHQNNTKSQKKEGCNRQNIYFILSDRTRDQPKKCTNGISDTDNPSEIEWSYHESEEYSEPYISATDPGGKLVELFYRGDKSISSFFSEEKFCQYPEREK